MTKTSLILRFLLLAGVLFGNLIFIQDGQARQNGPHAHIPSQEKSVATWQELEPQVVYASTQPGAPCLNGDEIRMEVWNVGALGGEQYEEVVINGKRGEFIFSGGENGYLLQSGYKGQFNTLEAYLQNKTLESGEEQTFWMWWQFIDGQRVEQITRWKNFGDTSARDTVRCVLAVENPEAFRSAAPQPEPTKAQPTQVQPAAQPGSDPGPVVDPGSSDPVPSDPISSDPGDTDAGAAIGGVVLVGALGAAAVILGGGAILVIKNLGAPKGGVKAPPPGQPPPAPQAPGGDLPPGIYGTGTPADPFRDRAAFKTNPDGSISNYAENAHLPPRIQGKGTPDDPYRNADPGLAGAPVNAPAIGSPQAPAQPAAKKAQPQEKKKQPDQITHYEITCQPGQATIESGKPASLQVQVWAIYKSGLRQPAPQVALQTTCDEPAVLAHPAAGAGTLFLTLSLAGQAASQSATLTVYAYPVGMAPVSQSVSLQIKARKETPVLQVQLDPDRRTVYPDGQDMIAVWARVAYQDPQAAPDADLQAANDSLEFIREGEAENWLYDNASQKNGDWTAFWVKAADLLELQRQFGPTHPPAGGVTLAVQARYQDQSLSERLVFRIPDVPVLQTDSQRIELCAGRQQELILQAWLEGEWPGPWQFVADFEGEELADVTVSPSGDSRAQLTLHGPKINPEKGLRLNESYVSSRLLIRAQKQNNPQVEIQATVNALVFQEGLYVASGLDSQGKCALRGDLGIDSPERATRLRFKALIWDDQRRQAVEDPEPVRDLEFSTHPSSPEQVANALTAVRLVSKNLEAQGAPPGSWTLELGDDLLAKNSAFEGGALLVRSVEKPELEAELPIVLHALPWQEKTDWQEAYDNCIHIIQNYTPEYNRREQLEYLEKMKAFWGVAELNRQRKIIWDLAQETIFQDAQNWRESANRWNWALRGAKLVKYVNDVFFDLTAMGILLHPAAVLAAKEVKDGIEAVVQTYIENPDTDWWDWYGAYAKQKFWGSLKNVGNFSLKEMAQHMGLKTPMTMVLLGVWRFINHYFWVPNSNGTPKGFAEACVATFKDLMAEAAKTSLKRTFQQWGVEDGWIDQSELTK